MARWIAFGCTHLPIHSEEFRQWRLAKISEYRPKEGEYYVVNLGDWLDGDAASRWPNEHKWTLADEYRLLAQDALDIRDAAGPDARLVWLYGNHDANLITPNRLDPKLREVCHWRNNKDAAPALEGWKVIDRYGHDAKWRLGQITFQHGCQVNLNAEMEQAVMHGVPYGLHVSAHTHRPVHVTLATLRSKIPLFGVHYANVGCGCDWERMEYVERTNISMWGRAVVIGEANNKQRRAWFGSKQWDAHLELHSRASEYAPVR